MSDSGSSSTRPSPAIADIDEVDIDRDDVAARLLRPEVTRPLARLLLRRARERLTAEPTPVPLRKP